jgi:hypothetical protein
MNTEELVKELRMYHHYEAAKALVGFERRCRKLTLVCSLAVAAAIVLAVMCKIT